MSRVLICIDCQNDFISNTLGSEAANAAVPNIRALIDEFMENNEDIIFTKDLHSEHYLDTFEGKHLPVPHCIVGTWGAELDKRINILRTYEHSAVISKSTFGYTGWMKYMLNQYDEIVICGLVSSICVMTNVQLIHAFYPEVPITFVENASAGLSPEDHEAACQIMRDCQINVISL